jgi:hypothetical protein
MHERMKWKEDKPGCKQAVLPVVIHTCNPHPPPPPPPHTMLIAICGPA